MRCSPGPLWVVTSFFNPMGYQRRTSNYARFREAISLPLATIELGFNECWCLDSAAADIYLRIGHGAVLWQKERLLNHLLDLLPSDCRYVAWIDCDLLFVEEDWADRLIEALARDPLVQPFSKIRYLGPSQLPSDTDLHVDGVAMRVVARQDQPAAIGFSTERTGGAPSSGMAWAAHRDVLARHGLYDGCIVGGGDTALACAALGVPGIAVALHAMNQWQQCRYLTWAEGFHRDIAGRIGVVRGEVQHLWHGDLADRKAGLRHAGLAIHEFNPEADIRIGPEGAWLWNSDKPALHAYLFEYFRSRKEDGLK